MHCMISNYRRPNTKSTSDSTTHHIPAPRVAVLQLRSSFSNAGSTRRRATPVVHGRLSIGDWSIVLDSTNSLGATARLMRIEQIALANADGEVAVPDLRDADFATLRSATESHAQALFAHSVGVAHHGYRLTMYPTR